MTEIAIPEIPYRIDDDVRDQVLKQLSRRNEPGDVKERFMFHFESRSVQRWQTEASVEGFHFLSDEGPEQGGLASGPAPLRYFIGGVVIAVQVWIIKLAAVAKVQVHSLRCGADAYRDAGPDENFPAGRGFARIDLTVDLKTDWTGDPGTIAQIVSDAVVACPATVTIMRALELKTRVIHNGTEIAVL